VRRVFDTNIFISALVIPGSLAEKAIQRIIDGEDVLLLSREILDELLTVLATKFSRDKEEISRVAVTLTDMAEWIEPNLRVSALQDDPDNRVLECAVSGEADVIVTGDREMLRMRRYGDIRIVSLKAYLSNEPR
jgi:putative PIN family toxin of toxin-antitoxin system